MNPRRPVTAPQGAFHAPSLRSSEQRTSMSVLPTLNYRTSIVPKSPHFPKQKGQPSLIPEPPAPAPAPTNLFFFFHTKQTLHKTHSQASTYLPKNQNPSAKRLVTNLTLGYFVQIASSAFTKLSAGNWIFSGGVGGMFAVSRCSK